MSEFKGQLVTTPYVGQKVAVKMVRGADAFDWLCGRIVEIEEDHFVIQEDIKVIVDGYKGNYIYSYLRNSKGKLINCSKDIVYERASVKHYC